MGLVTVQRFDAADGGAPRLVTVQRYDRGGELLNPVEQSDGSVMYEGRVARPCIMAYRQADGSIRYERVTKETLLRKDDLKSLGRKSVTKLHPSKFVTPETYQDAAAGDTGEEPEGDPESGFVRVKFAVRRADALKAIADGKLGQLSPGYTAVCDETPGYDAELGGHYDATQISRDYNHLALVPEARGGCEIVFRTDAGDAADESLLPIPAPQPRNDAMLTLSDEQKTLLRRAGCYLPDEGVIEAFLKLFGGSQAKLDAMISAITETMKKADASDAAVAELERAVGIATAQKTRADAAELLSSQRIDAAEVDTRALAIAAELVPLRIKADDLGIDGVDKDSVPVLTKKVALKLKSDAKQDGTHDYYVGIVAGVPTDPHAGHGLPKAPEPKNDAPDPKAEKPKSRADSAFEQFNPHRAATAASRV